jgi:hypothetical protein
MAHKYSKKKYNIQTRIYEYTVNSKQQIKMLPMPTYAQAKPIVKDVIKGVNAICPNPNVTVTLPNKITFGCR